MFEMRVIHDKLLKIESFWVILRFIDKGKWTYKIWIKVKKDHEGTKKLDQCLDKIQRIILKKLIWMIHYHQLNKNDL